MNNNSVITLKNVKKSFDGRIILNKLNLSLHKSDSISIIGASGVGKTTLMNIIGMLEFPDYGEVYWDNLLVSQLTSNAVARIRGETFGFVFQSHSLISELSVLDNILLPTRIARGHKSPDLEFIEFLLERVGLFDYKFSQITKLSGGEKQRVSIVRALVNRPKIILADEPTGNLDESTSASVIELILSLCKEIHSALLLITHNKSLSRLMDKQFVLSNAVLTQQHDEL